MDQEPAPASSLCAGGRRRLLPGRTCSGGARRGFRLSSLWKIGRGGAAGTQIQGKMRETVAAVPQSSGVFSFRSLGLF